MTELAEPEKLDLPDRWKPQQGETITGRVSGHEQGRGRSGWVHAYIIEPADDDARAVYMSNHDLRDAARDAEQVSIRFHAEHPHHGALFSIQHESD